MTQKVGVRFVAALFGLAAVGMSGAGFLGAAPEPARVAIALFGVVVTPALLLVPLARRWIGGPRAAIVSVALFLVLSLHAVVSEVFRQAGASFLAYASAITWALIVGFLAILVRSWTRRREPSLPRPWRASDVRFLVGLGALVAIAAWSRHGFGVGEDAFDHIGFVRRVIAFDSMRPDHVLAWPVDAGGSLPLDPRKGALHPTVAWIAALAAADPAAVWSMLPLVLFPAFVLAFTAFSQALLRSRRLLVVCVALFLLSYAGTAFQLAHAAAYGQNLAAAWYWILAAIALSPTRDAPSRTRLAAVAILSFGGTLTHVGVALHATVLAASLVLFAGWFGFTYRTALVYAATLVVAAGAAAFVRLGVTDIPSNPIHAHAQGVLFLFRDDGVGWFVMSPMEILRQHGMATLGGLVLLPLLAFVARRRVDARAVLALCVVPAGVAFFPPLSTALFATGSYMVFRSLLNAPVFAASAIVLVWAIGTVRRKGIVMRAVAAVGIAAWVLAFLRPSIDATMADASKRSPATAVVSEGLVDYVATLPVGSTILTDPMTAYALSAHTPHRFVALFEQHANPCDPFALDRLEAVRNALSPFVTPERCVDACRRYGVDFVVVNADAHGRGFMAVWDASLYRPTLKRLRAVPSFREVRAARSFVSFRFAPVASSPAEPDPLRPPVVVESPRLDPCLVLAPDRVFEVIGVAVTPAHAQPGDSVTIVIGYRRNEATPFGFPLLIHLRFDHEELAEGESYIGDKYVRRLRERRRGVVTRFREDVRPGAGVFDPDLWPMGAELCERVRMVIPPRAVAGSYRVEVRIVRDSLIPNFHVRDLLYNRDHYSGTACATLVVGDRG